MPHDPHLSYTALPAIENRSSPLGIGFPNCIGGHWGRPSPVTAPERFGPLPPADETGPAAQRVALAWVKAFADA